jgi:hypothetical protein
MNTETFEFLEKYMNFLKSDLSKVPLNVKKEMISELKKLLKVIKGSNTRASEIDKKMITNIMNKIKKSMK